MPRMSMAEAAREAAVDSSDAALFWYWNGNEENMVGDGDEEKKSCFFFSYSITLMEGWGGDL